MNVHRFVSQESAIQTTVVNVSNGWWVTHLVSGSGRIHAHSFFVHDEHHSVEPVSFALMSDMEEIK